MAEKMFRVTLTAPEKLELGYADIPEPKPGEIRIKVFRVGVCGSDPTIYFGRHPYVTYPVVMGHEFSGTADKLGEGVDFPAVGTRVAVIPHLVCGKCPACASEKYNFCEELRCTGAEADGAHCQYICMPREMVLPIPDTMSFDDAAMVEPACVGYHAAKRGEIRSTDHVLVIGAGPIGLFCMQSCKALGARCVTVADVDPRRLDLARSLGADHVVNVAETPFSGKHAEFDLFFDCVGGKGQVLNKILEMARRGTRIVMVGVLQNGYDIPLLPDFVQHELRLSGTTMYVPQDYREMIALMGEGRIRTRGMITHYFPLQEIETVFDLIKNRREPFFKIMLTVND